MEMWLNETETARANGTEAQWFLIKGILNVSLSLDGALMHCRLCRNGAFRSSHSYAAILSAALCSAMEIVAPSHRLV